MMLYKGEEFSLFIILYDHFLYCFSLEHFFVLRKFVSREGGDHMSKKYTIPKNLEKKKRKPYVIVDVLGIW